MYCCGNSTRYKANFGNNKTLSNSSELKETDMTIIQKLYKACDKNK